MDLTKLKILLFESKYPYFTDEELTLFLEENEGDVYKTASELCLLKADSDNKVTVGPITIEGAGADYWTRLSYQYSRKIKPDKPGGNGYITRMKRC